MRRLSLESWLVLLFLIAFIFVQLTLFIEESERGSAYERYSSLRAEADGTLALFEYLDTELEKTPKHWKRELIGLPENSTVLVIQPREKKDEKVLGVAPIPNDEVKIFGDKERLALSQWIKRGGHLILSSDQKIPFLDELKANFLASPNDKAINSADVKPAALGPWTAGVKRIEAKSSATIKLDSPAWLPLLQNERGVFAATRDYGNGSVTLLADSFVLSNEGISKADNAIFVSNLLQLRPKPVFFDEYRHGLTEVQNVVSFLTKHGLHYFLIHCIVLYLLVWWSWTARSGRVRAPHEAAPIQSSEYISAMAHIYARADLQGHAISWFERRLLLCLRFLLNNDQLGYIEEADSEKVSSELERSGVVNYQGFRAYLQARKSILSNNPKAVTSRGVYWDRVRKLPDDSVLALIRLAIRLEREWLEKLSGYNETKLLKDLGIGLIEQRKREKEEARKKREENKSDKRDQDLAARYERRRQNKQQSADSASEAVDTPATTEPEATEPDADVVHTFSEADAVDLQPDVAVDDVQAPRAAQDNTPPTRPDISITPEAPVDSPVDQDATKPAPPSE